MNQRRSGSGVHRPADGRRPFPDDLFLLAPAIAIGLFFSFFSSVQLGIRYLLPAFPLLFVWVGGLLTRTGESRAGVGLQLGAAGTGRLRMVALTLLVSAAISSLAAFPDYIAYTNELVVPKRRAYRIMADSNLEWGQDRFQLKRYLSAHPDARYQPKVPVAGHLVVRVNFLVGVFHEERYRWLRENFDPDAALGGSYLIYRVTEENLAKATGQERQASTPGA